MGSYVHLNRRFQSIQNQRIDESTIYQSYLPNSWNERRSVLWATILENRISVILGEAGSGKTKELITQSERLFTEGKYSFFIRLEKLADPNYSEALSEKDINQFQSWLMSNDKAYFFLDSVDESKIQGINNFDDAIDGLKKLIKDKRVADCHFIISSRYSDWNHSIDINSISKLINGDILESFEIDSSTVTDFESGLLIEKEKTESKEKINPISIYKLLPLDKHQVSLFARSQGITNVEKFISEIDDKYAWVLARRPLDVIGLIEYYIENDGIGNLYDITKFDVALKLKYKRGTRADESITIEKARLGIELLAATSFLTKKPNFRIPTSRDPIFDDLTLKCRDFLPEDWTNKEVEQLLSKPLFDIPSYSKIRFHHRTYVEYLTAEWFRNLFNKNCDYFDLIDIFTGTRREEQYIKLRFKPILAWLAIGDNKWNDLIRKKILNLSPELFLKFGDPNSLPIEYKKELLQKIKEKLGRKENYFESYEDESLSRLADSSLIDEINSSLLDSNNSDNFKQLLVKISLYGRLKGVLDSVLTISLKDDTQYLLKDICLSYVSKFGSINDHLKVFEHYLSKPVLDSELVGTICNEFYPKSLSRNDLVSFIKKVEGVNKFSVGLDWVLSRQIEILLDNTKTEDLVFLLDEISQHSISGTFTTYHYEDSTKFSWLSDTLNVILNELLKRDSVVGNEKVIATALFAIKNIKNGRYTNKKIDKERLALIMRNTSVRKEYAKVYFIKFNKVDNGYYNVFNDFHFINSQKTDSVWILEAISESIDREKEFFFILALSIRRGTLFSTIFDYKLKKLAVGNKTLEKELDKIKGGVLSAIKNRLLYRFGLANTRSKIKKYQRELKHWYIRQKNKYYYYKDLGQIRSGNHIRFLTFLAQYSFGDSSNLGSFNFDKLVEKTDRLIAKSTVKGYKKFWRNYFPKFPYERKTSNIDMKMVVGLMGLNLEIEANEIDFSRFKFEDVELAMRYGMNEFNGYSSWMKLLVHVQELNFKTIVTKVIGEEWNTNLTYHNNSIIHHARYTDKYILPLINDTLLSMVQISDPVTPNLLADTISCLITNKDNRNSLIEIAKNRLSNHQFFNDLDPVENYYVQTLDYTRNSIKRNKTYSTFKWLIILLQLDARSGLEWLEKICSLSIFKKEFITKVASSFSSRSDYNAVETLNNPDYLKAEFITRLFFIIYRNVHPTEDINRIGGGAYSPGDRDYAQEFRNFLLNKIFEIDDEKVDLFLRRIALSQIFKPHREYIEHRLLERNERLVSLESWSPSDLKMLSEKCLKNPSNDHELFTVVNKILSEIKKTVEFGEGDVELVNYVRKDDNEIEFRKFLKLEFDRRASDIFRANQEVEIVNNDRPDIRIDKSDLTPLSIEVKKADNGTFNELVEGLKDQLIGRYLSNPSYGYGIYGIARIDGKKYWVDGNKKRYSFTQLVQKLNEIAERLVASDPSLFGVKVIGMDFGDR